MDATAHYRHLVQLGRDEFLAAAAPAALVRFRASDAELFDGAGVTLPLDMPGAGHADETLPFQASPGGIADAIHLEVFPLSKKPGASFPDRITLGRTPNNDIVIVDHSVSRLHAYVRQDGDGWVIADAGSKNGSWLAGAALGARKERALRSKTVLRLGDVDLTFYVAGDLFAALGGS